MPLTPTTEQQPRVPLEIQCQYDTSLPALSPEVLGSLTAAGWQRVGIMAAIVDSAGDVMMLHHRAGEKCPAGALGPLGETSQQNDSTIEQPSATLLRGLQEEIGLTVAPSELFIPSRRGWHINAWPHGHNNPNEFSAAISFPVFINDSLRRAITSNTSSSTEISGRRSFMSPDAVLGQPDDKLRLGVRSWLNGLLERGSLSNTQTLITLPYPNIVKNGTDITLQNNRHAT